MPRKGEINLDRLKYWRQILAAFEASGLSGQEYCRKNGVPYTAFANRRRRIALMDAQALTEKKPASKKFAGRKPAASASSAKTPRDVEFAEVKLSDRDLGTKAPIQLAGVVSTLEIVLPNGIVVRLPQGYPLHMLSQVVSIMEEC